MTSIYVREWPLCLCGNGLFSHIAILAHSDSRTLPFSPIAILCAEWSLFLCGNGLYLITGMASSEQCPLSLCGNGIVGAGISYISVREWHRRCRNVLYVGEGMDYFTLWESPLSMCGNDLYLGVGMPLCLCGNGLYVCVRMASSRT
ncbi:hypothetical protein CDAR_60791 [Caerostris darwini]|uniref:Uncharacterized protein n=1 Tax=Caerostris darwini TaxID=1538125 RepID=A0AAV4VJ38_9ARAC|nr:hypothetical protein CDAR_60791 [Caerostris darwini]